MSPMVPIRRALRSPGLRAAGAFLMIDVVYLYWVWAHFPNWGIWDWDFYQTLLEAARISIVDYQQLPLWNPYLGGGFTLVGHPQVRTFNPSFLVILAFGTIHGVKLSILLYLLIAQAGAYRLARTEQLSRMAAFLVAIVFSLSGWYVQHLAHGHFTWLGFVWTPFIVLALDRAVPRLRPSTLAAGGLFYGFLLLDGGPYGVGFTPVFLGAYALLIAIRARSPRPLVACAAIFAIGAAIAAVQVIPILETFLSFPRRTGQVNNFYGAPFEPTALGMLYQGLVSRSQAHDASEWMPYILNVGSYVGWIPLLLGLAALVRRPDRSWPMAVAFLFSLWIFLGPAAPVDLWALLHELPILGSLQVPARFNVFVLLALALLAGHGLDALEPLLARSGRPIGWALTGIVVIDLLAVNAPVFKVAFSIPPVPVREAQAFHHELESPYLEGWTDRPLYPLFQNWSNVTYASTLENTGVILAWNNLKYARNAIPKGDPSYPGAEVWVEPGSGDLRITSSTITPGRITVEVSGQAGRLVLNQNYHPGWKLLDGPRSRVEPVGGRATFLVSGGDQRLHIEFKPIAFQLGAIVSLLALGAVGVALLNEKLARPKRRPGYVAGSPTPR